MPGLQNKPSSTVGLKDFTIAPVNSDSEEGTVYGEVQKVAGIIEASVTPGTTDPDIQYADDIEFDTVYPDPEIDFRTKLADLPLDLQKMILGNTMDQNGVLLRKATDKPPYFAVGFKSERANGKFRYVWLLKVRAKPITENYQSKEGTTITRQAAEVEWTAVKRASDGFYQAVADEGENSFSGAATFLDTVYVPSLGA